MTQEAVADARALGRALDQPWDVGEHELAALVPDDSELRAERGEGIVADLGGSVADRIEEGRLAGVGQADESDVGEQLEAQPDPHFLAVFTGLVLARGAVGRGLVAGVAAPAHAALQEGHALAGLCEISQQGTFVVIRKNLGADRNLDDEIVAACTGAIGTGAALAARGAEMLGVAEVDQRIEAGHRLKDDVATLAPVAPVGAAELDELLAPEADGAGARSEEHTSE